MGLDNSIKTKDKLMRIEQHNTMRCFVAKLKEIGCSSGDGKYLLKCEKIFAGALMDTRQFGLHINSHKDLHFVREILLINQEPPLQTHSFL